MTSFRLRTIRLVNFHNFVDESIEVRDGGHLFLLGDNGSGKTTVLDAVHLVLAGGELELNAAARVGGRRDEGRTLQGVVLRYDRELGVRNQGGAIGYAAIELVEPGGRVITLGIGAEATTMEARVARWGFIVNRPLVEVALVDGARCPVDRERLQRQLGGGQVHATLTGYRKELARRLFGSESRYDEAVRFWGMAKAYREIVAGARDFGALFERLLPSPDGAIFDEILRTLRAIDDLELALGDLDSQRVYVGGLVDRVRDVALAREAAARCRWLACRREREELLAEARRQAELAEAARDAAERGRLDAEEARLRSEEADALLRRAESEDSAGVLASVRDAETHRRSLAVEVERARAIADEGRRARDRAATAAGAARDQLADGARRVCAELRSAATGVAEVPGELAAVARLAAAIEALAAPGAVGFAALPEPIEAVAEVDEVRVARDRTLIEIRVRQREAAARVAERSAELVELEAAGEATPMADGWPSARLALGEAGIAARPLHELLEPAPDADPAVLAAIESLAGEAVLAAIVVGADDRERARELVGATAPGRRVVVETCDAALPAWCEAALLLTPASATARSVLAAALSQPSGLRAVAAPADGRVALRGLAHRVEETEARWIGADARRRAHERRVAAARAALGLAEESERDGARRVDVAQRAVDRVDRLRRGLGEAMTTLTGAGHAADLADHRATLAAAVWSDADARAGAVATRLEGLDGELEALRARVEGIDLAELERRLAILREHTEVARARWHRLVEAGAAARAAADQARDRAETARTRAAGLEAQLGDATHELRAALAATGADPFAGDDAGLEHYVRVTQRGDSFRSLDTLRQRITDEERAAELAAAELEGDGSRGVRLLAHAGRFGFGYDRARNHVEDRRGQPLAGVLAELDRAIGEQRSVVNERTRALMDTLVMGELARHLQGQVHHLHETIKGINRVLRGLRFGPTEYQFEVRARADRAELIDLVRRLSILDEDSRHRFRAWVDARLDELRSADEHGPALLDYRRWFEFKLRISATGAAGVELTERLRVIGSGGEQGVPNYLLVLALAKLMFDAAGAAVRPLLFDEAFYGIDAGRRDQLLRLATDLDLQLLVASPDQDGATAAVRHATTLFVVKDADHDVHLAPYHYWNQDHAAQSELFAARHEPGAAECRTA